MTVVTECGAQLFECRLVSVVAGHVMQLRSEFFEDGFIDLVDVAGNRVARPCDQLIARPVIEGDTDDWCLKRAAFHHGVKGRKDHFAGKVAGGTEHYEHVRSLLIHGRRPHFAFSRWPPKALRMAESTLPANSASPREEKRSNRAEAKTGAGTPVSTAA
ncbi:hypothetical protein D3C71_1445750 [compost metagenome]